LNEQCYESLQSLRCDCSSHLLCLPECRYIIVRYQFCNQLAHTSFLRTFALSVRSVTAEPHASSQQYSIIRPPDDDQEVFCSTSVLLANSPLISKTVQRHTVKSNSCSVLGGAQKFTQTFYLPLP